MANIIIQDVRQARKEELAGKQDTIITFAALMGRGDGVRPDVDGREGYVWVRVGHAQALQMAYNSRVMPRDDLAIFVGYEPEQPNLLQVISVRQEGYVNTGQGMIPVVKDHHLTHEWGGGDDVWIAYRRLVDLHLGQPAGFVVTLNPGLIYRNGVYMWIVQQTIDLSGSQPAIGAQARYVLVYLDALGILLSRDGIIRPNPTALLVSDIPIPLAGELAIAAVRLYASQTAIGDDPDNRDIVELREFQPYSAAGIHELLSATHDDTTVAACILGDIITGQAGPLWKRLAISVPAANVRNVLGVDNGETGPTWKTALDGNNPTTIGIGDAAAPGTSLIFPHLDHQHGSPATWTATAHNLLSAIHGDTVANGATRGSLVYGNSTPAWDELVLGGAAGSLLTRDANDVLWSTYYMTGFAGHTYAWPDYNMSFPAADAHGYLHSDGAGTLTWDAGGAGGAHDLLSATHTDTVAQAVSRGSLVYGDSTPAWNELVIGGAAGSVLTRDANDVLWSGFYFSGTAGGTTTFAVTNAKTLTLTATGDFNLTIPATGTAALLGTANVFTESNTIASGKFLTCLTDGSGGGFKAGSAGDVLLYRFAADTWRTPDSLIVDGMLGVGATPSLGKLQVISEGAAPYVDNIAWLGGVNSALVVVNGPTYTSFVGRNPTNTDYLGLDFRARAAAGQFYLKTDGTVGVNTTAPADQLHIIGNLRQGYDTSNYLRVTVSSAGVVTFDAVGASAGFAFSDLITANANIQFPAVQVPDAGANVLDDYEEQTWTPALKFGGASVDMTYTTQSATYTKIGRLVFVSVLITLSAKGSSVGAATITGLPFTVANSVACAVYCAAVANLTSSIVGRPAGTSILLYDTAATANTPLDDTNFGNISVLNIGAVFSV